MKQAGIYRKLGALALTAATALLLPWLAAAGLWSMGPLPWTPAQTTVDSLVRRAVAATSAELTARRNFPAGGPPITVRVVDPPGMREARDDVARSVRSSENLGDEEALQRLLGLSGAMSSVARGEALTAPPVAPVAFDISGLYDVVGHRLFVANWVGLDEGRLAFTRDVAHAVLDRHFDLARWLSPVSPHRPGDGANSDAALARVALLNGDATAQALELIDVHGALPAPAELRQITDQARVAIAADRPEAPLVEVERRLFVELDGLSFVAGIRSRAPWAVVDQAWRQPPRSTEQILHVDKYRSEEAPDDVGARLPDRPRGDWTVTFRDTLGELGLRCFLKRAVGDYRAARAAAGWGGDRALLLVAGSHPSASRAPRAPRSPRAANRARQSTPGAFAAWITTWDDETDAADFTQAAAQALAGLANTNTDADAASMKGTSPGRLVITDDAGRIFMLESRRRVVGLLIGAPPKADTLLSELVSAVSAAAAKPGSFHRAPRGRASDHDQGRARSR